MPLAHRICFLFFLSVFVAGCNRGLPKSSVQFREWQQLLLQRYEGESIARVDLSADGNWLLAANTHHILRLWEMAQPDQPRLYGVSGALANAVFLGDPSELMIANQNGLVQLWDYQLHDKTFEYHFPEGAGHAIADAPGRYLAYGGYVYDRQGAGMLGEPAVHAVQSALSMSMQPSVLTAGYHDGALILRDLTTGKTNRWLGPQALTAATISTDGKYVIAGNRDGHGYLWHVPAQEPVRQWNMPGRVLTIEVASTCKWFVVVTDAGFDLYQFNPFALRARVKLKVAVRSVDVSRQWIAFGDDGGNVHVWQSSDGSCLWKRNIASSPITSIRLLADQSYIAAGSYSGDVAVFRLKTP
ncbi:MAG: hypothetical protein GY737_08260 [Desulfobacteraceae bacterium]|nr:hypothetical protein [Desulfobacteraceae bacterium]